jgi:hypothetical protein
MTYPLFLQNKALTISKNSKYKNFCVLKDGRKRSGAQFSVIAEKGPPMFGAHFTIHPAAPEEAATALALHQLIGHLHNVHEV